MISTRERTTGPIAVSPRIASSAPALPVIATTGPCGEHHAAARHSMLFTSTILINREESRFRSSRLQWAMRIETRQLSECPEHLTTVAAWVWEQWWQQRTPTPALVIDLFRTHSAFDRVPYTVVGLVDGVPVGSCSVCPPHVS